MPNVEHIQEKCHFGNLPDQFIIIFQMAVYMWPVHGICVNELRSVVTMIEIVLSIHIQSLGMEWSMKNKFPYHVLFPEIPTYCTLILPSVKLRFSFDQFELLFTWGSVQEYQAR